MVMGTRGGQEKAEAGATTRSTKKRGRTVAAQPAQGGPSDKGKAPESTGGTDSGEQAVGAARRATRRTARGRDATTDNPNPGPAEEAEDDPLDTTTTPPPATTDVAAVASADTSTVISDSPTPSTPAATQPGADLPQGGIAAGACCLGLWGVRSLALMHCIHLALAPSGWHSRASLTARQFAPQEDREGPRRLPRRV